MVNFSGAVDLTRRTLDENATLREQINTVMAESATLKEGLEKVQDMLRREDRGWLKLFDADEDEGLTLENLKEWSAKIRTATVGAPWIKHGLGLRSTYVWQGGMKYAGIPTEGRGKGTNVQKLIDLPINQRNFFGKGARRRREGCLYHDGLAVWFGDDRTKKLDPITLSEITGQLRDPDHKSVIWAYRREWTHTDLKTGKGTKKVEWVFVDEFVDKRVPTITRDGITEKVNQTLRAFDMHANSMEGFAYGSPDALAGLIWSEIARDAYMDGVTLTSAMATFAFKATSTTKTGADNASMKLATPGGAGQTAVLGATNDLVPMSSAGKGYDFSTLRGLTAVIAASLDVSNIALTADVAAAGSSYGSASTLDLPTRLAMEARRCEHIDLDSRVLRWMGAKDATPFFDTLDDSSEIFREVQALLLLWSSGMYKPEPLENRLSVLLGIVGNSVPDGILIPNNQASWERSDIDPKDGPAGGSQTSSVGKPNATPAGQGQNSAAGAGVKGNDLRTDQLANMLTTLQAFIASEDKIREQRNAA